MKNHIQAKGLSRHLVLTLAFVAGACSSGGGGSNGGNGGTQSTTGHGGSSPAGSGGSGVGGTQGSGGSGTGGSNAGTAGSSAGSAGSAGSGAAGTTGGTGGSAGSGAAAGTSGGSGGRGGSGGSAGGGTAGANGGAGGRGGSAGSAGANGGAGGRGGSAGSGGGNQDGGSTDAVMVMDGAVSNGVYVRTAWTATYTCTGTCPAQDSADTVDADTKRAFDGTLATRWSTGQYQQSSALMSKFPLYFTVDMHETVNISRIVMDPGNQDHYDAPGQMDVLVSLDGTTYTTIVSAHKPMTPSNGMPDDITFTRTPARYIQLKATMTIKQVNNALGDRFWAIGEMNVYP